MNIASMKIASKVRSTLALASTCECLMKNEHDELMELGIFVYLRIVAHLQIPEEIAFLFLQRRILQKRHALYKLHDLSLLSNFWGA